FNGDNQLNGDNESVHQVEREDNRNSDGAKTNSTGSKKFKMSEIPRTGGYILSVMEEIVKVGITIGYNMDSYVKAEVLRGFLLVECIILGATKSASKMSKLDRFLSDHCPILLREASFDYGPTPCRFFHFWFDVDGFDKFVTDSWKDAPGDDSNDMRNLCVVRKFLKSEIELGNGSDEIVNNRLEILGILLELLKQQKDLECMVSKEEVKRAVRDCGTDKSSGPDGFTFGFYRHFWSTIENDVFEAIKGWIQNCLNSSKGSILVNGSPTEEFQFYKGLKQGDPLSPFLFILVMESLHISFQRVVDVGMFTGIKLSSLLNISHLFYADDAIFLGQWNDSNIDTLVHVMECFYHVSGLRINLCKKQDYGYSRRRF
ncbi:RNA-directed DNA polymerase, eukaryota, reverse transcriptase zinc-binding domain protein, partial [Tanacetum coccineum]